MHQSSFEFLVDGIVLFCNKHLLVMDANHFAKTYFSEIDWSNAIPLDDLVHSPRTNLTEFVEGTKKQQISVTDKHDKAIRFSMLKTGANADGSFYLLLRKLPRNSKNRDLQPGRRSKSYSQYSSSCILLVDRNCDILYGNKQFKALFGFSEEQIELLSMHAIVADYAVYLQLEGDVRECEEAPISIGQPIKCLKRNAEPIWMKIQMQQSDSSEAVVLILDDVSVQMEIQQELDKAKALVKEVETERTRLLANISHELRTPLTSIRGILSNMGINQALSMSADEWSMMLHAADSLNEVIEEMLLFAQDSNSQIQSNISSLVLSDFIYQIAGMINLQHQDLSEVEFEIVLADDLPNRIMADRFHLQQIIFNLVTNAFKFTNSGFVRLEIYSNGVYRDDAFVLCIEVVDSGCGIPKDKLDRIFLPFQQINNTATRSASGLGLGLSIVQKLVDLMHGTVSVTSELNEGTSFWVTLPLDIDTSDASSAEASQAPLPVSAPTGLNILLVEDNFVNSEIIAKHFRQLDNHVFTALNGQIAVNLMQEQVFDIVLMDVQMPIMDGFTATTIIRTDKKISDCQNKDIKILGLTADATLKAREQCLRSGMDEVVNKPVVFEELYLVINELLFDQSTQHTNDNLRASHSSEMTLQLSEDANKFLSSFTRNHNEQETMLATIDLDSAIQYSTGDCDFYRECIKVMLPSIRQLRSIIRMPKEQTDYAAITFEAHQLASAAAMVGAVQLADCARDTSHYFDQHGVCDALNVEQLGSLLDKFFEVTTLILRT